MHTVIVSHGETKGRISFERKAKEAILIEGNTNHSLGFLHKPKHENEVTDLIKKKKSSTVILSECPAETAGKIIKAVNRKFNGSSPRIFILGGKIDGAVTIGNLSEISMQMA